MAHTIAMVHRFALDQMPAKQVFCDEDVFEHIWVLSGSGVVGNANDDVPGLLP